MSSNTMGTTATPRLRREWEWKSKAFFSKLGMEIKDIGTDIQKVISAAGKEMPVIEPVLNATLQQIFPSALIPVQVIEKVIGAAFNAASQVATALEGEGLSPTADQVAAVAVAGLVHSLKRSTAGSNGRGKVGKHGQYALAAVGATGQWQSGDARHVPLGKRARWV